MPDFKNAYKRRYEEPVIRQIERAHDEARRVGGSLLVGFHQGGEPGMEDETGEEQGLCYSLATRWFRGKLRQEGEEVFHEWLLTSNPTRSASNSRLRMDLFERNYQMKRWQTKQSFAITLHQALVDDLRENGLKNDDDPEGLVAEYLETLKAPEDEPSRYDLAFNARHPLGRDDIPKQTFFTITGSQAHIEYGWKDRLYPVQHDMLRQLAVRKILKKFTSPQRFSEPKRSRNFIFKLDGKEGCHDAFALQFREALESCSNRAFSGTTELFIYINLWGAKPHAMGAYHLAYSFSSQQGHAELFDANHGIFQFSLGGPPARCRALGNFLSQLLKREYKDSTLISLYVLAVQ